jgi:hypothetical protein
MTQCKEVNEFDQTFDFEAFKAEHSDLESIRKLLEQLARWDGRIATHIKPAEYAGLIWAQGKKLREKLGQRVRTEQAHLKEYLRELAEKKAKESTAGLAEIRQRLKEPLTNLSTYVQYVTELELCRQRCEEIAGQKKKLDEMKGVLSKYKSKDGEAGFGAGFGHGALQARIEQLQADIEVVNGELQAAEGRAKEAREGNVEQLEEKVLAE